MVKIQHLFSNQKHMRAHIFSFYNAHIIFYVKYKTILASCMKESLPFTKKLSTLWM